MNLTLKPKGQQSTQVLTCSTRNFTNSSNELFNRTGHVYLSLCSVETLHLAHGFFFVDLRDVCPRLIYAT